MIAGKEAETVQGTAEVPKIPKITKGVSFEEPDKKAIFKNFRKGSKGLNIGKILSLQN